MPLSSALDNDSITTAATSRAVKILNERVNPICDHIYVANDREHGRTEMSSENREAFLQVRNDGSCGVWYTPKNDWAFLFDRDGKLIRGSVPSSGLGVGQRWYEVTRDRLSEATYTNNTGKPIMINITVSRPANSYKSRVPIIIDDCRFYNHGGNDKGLKAGESFSTSLIIPDGSSYKTECENIIYWAELR
ncbi:phage tail protein [Gilliamella apicola]|uniref:phage tail protein n=1 Tax=Gilliamella sp. wkB308 TaxID=3120263 RepID=UPI00211CDC88